MAIWEQRTYTLLPGKMPEMLEIYGRATYARSREMLGDPTFVFSTEVGPLNQFITQVRYDSFEDRLARRAAFRATGDYRAYAELVRPMIRRQESKLMLPAPCFAADGG